MTTPAEAQTAVTNATKTGSPVISKTILASVLTTIVASITTVYAVLAPIDSPTFTGTPRGPTAAVDTNTTQLSTTAFVLGQAGTANPVMDSTAAPGSSLRYSRQDHVHPTDTSRAPANFTSAEAGAIARTVNNKLADIVSVCDFSPGCDLTGATSETTAFTSAIAAMQAKGGGVIYVPAGKHKIDGAGIQVLTGENIKIVGAGTSSTMIINATTDKPAIVFGVLGSVGGPFLKGNEVSNLTVVGASGVTGLTGQTGLSLYQQQFFRIENFVVDGNRTGYNPLYRGMYIQNNLQGFFNNVEVQYSTLDGISLISHSDFYISNMRSDHNGQDGFLLSGAQGMFVINATSLGNTRYGWNFGYDATRPNSNNFLSNVIGDGNGNTNWAIVDLADTQLSDVWASSNLSTAVNATAVGFLLQTSNVKNVSFNGGMALNNNYHGVSIYNDGATGSPTNIRFTNFTFGSTSVGAYGNGQAGAGYGLAINGTSDVTVIGGKMQGNASGTYTNTSTGAIEISKVTGTVADLTSRSNVETIPRIVTAATDTILDADTSIIANRAGTITLTLPAAASYCGRVLKVRTIQAQTVVSASSNVTPLAGGADGTAILAATAGKFALLKSNCVASWNIEMQN